MALSAKGDPLTLRVTEDNPVCTDPDATIAWTDGVSTDLKTDLPWRLLVGHGGGETIQMMFRGHGYVIVHSNEEDAEKRSFFKRVKTVFGKLVP